MELGDGKYFLQWNDFQNNVVSAFSEMRNDTEFTDVTLVCEDNQKIEAHRVILSASSTFFGNILMENKHPHPLIYLRDVKGRDLVSILDFIYHGETNIHQEHLEEFMWVAGDLHIQGLNIPKKQFTTNKRKISTTIEYDTKTTTTTIQPKSEPKEVTLVPLRDEAEAHDAINKRNSSIRNIEDLDREINSLIQKGENKGVSCKMCGIKMSTTQSMGNHIEAKHIDGFSHPCTKCETEKSFKTRHSLSVHISKSHRNLAVE